jgi:hypothetical protein
VGSSGFGEFQQIRTHPYPDSKIIEKQTPTRLVTGRYQELGRIVRPAFIYNGNLNPEKMPWVEEALLVDDLIGFIPCSAIYICGALSASAGREIRNDWVTRTGAAKHTGKRLQKRRVEAKVLPGVGHFGPMESPIAFAGAVAEWIDEEVGEWEKEDEKLRAWRNLALDKKEELAKTWMASLKAKF